MLRRCCAMACVGGALSMVPANASAPKVRIIEPVKSVLAMDVLKQVDGVAFSYTNVSKVTFEIPYPSNVCH